MKTKLLGIISSMAIVVVMTTVLCAPVLAASHAANGENVFPATGKWKSFSICYDHSVWPKMTEWEDSLTKVKCTNEDGTYKYDNWGDIVYQTKGVDYATEGFVVNEDVINDYNNKNYEIPKINSSDPDSVVTNDYLDDYGYSYPDFKCHVVDSGWDGNYYTSRITGVSSLTGDNQWGLTNETTGIPCEFGRLYVIKFKIASTLRVNTNNINNPIYEPYVKHISFKAYDYQSSGGPAAEFSEAQGATKQGMIELTPSTDKDHLNWKEVSATFQIPADKAAWSNGKDKGSTTKMGVLFAMGAFLKTYPKEVAMKGDIYLKDMEILAQDQFAANYYNGSKLVKKIYYNTGETIDKVAMKKKGYTMVGYQYKNGTAFDMATPMEKDIDLYPRWTKTKGPAKPVFEAKSRKSKKCTVTIDEDSAGSGFEAQYSLKKNMKKAKIKNIGSSKTGKISGLKKYKVYYIRTRAYNKDSAGNKVYGAWTSTRTFLSR